MQTVIGAFEDRESAQQALERLVEAGFDRDDVHVEDGAAGLTSTGSTDTTGTTAAGAGGTRIGDDDRDGERGVLESIGHFFASLFDEDRPTPAGRSGIYAEAVRRGSSVVIVDARDDDEAEQASALLQQLGAFDVDERAQQWRAGGWTGDDDDQRRNRPQAARDFDDTREGKREGVMDVVQEELEVGKRSVDRGGVRVIQRVSEKPVRELVRLREERAIVERRPVDREATADDLSNFREGSIELRETAEEPVVAKRARVVEEVRVGKQVQEREQAIEDTVRRKDVDVERIEGQGDRIGERERERAVAADADEGMATGARERDLVEGEARKTTRKTTGKKPTGR